jgi:hypothetical protein
MRCASTYLDEIKYIKLCSLVSKPNMSCKNSSNIASVINDSFSYPSIESCREKDDKVDTIRDQGAIEFFQHHFDDTCFKRISVCEKNKKN